MSEKPGQGASSIWLNWSLENLQKLNQAAPTREQMSSVTFIKQ